MSDKLSELDAYPNSTSPRVDELIAGVMKRFPGVSASAQARYYEEVHQHLAPLARELEAENARLRANAVAIWNNRRASPAPAIPACSCDMRTKVLGDGCQVCRPENAPATSESEDSAKDT